MLNPFRKKEKLQYNNITNNPRLVSADYKTYRKDEKLKRESTFFEKMCFLSGKLIQLKFGKKMQDNLEKNIRVGRLSIKPEDVGALLLVSLGLMLLDQCRTNLIIPIIQVEQITFFVGLNNLAVNFDTHCFAPSNVLFGLIELGIFDGTDPFYHGIGRCFHGSLHEIDNEFVA